MRKLILILAAFISGCGWTPMYSTSDSKQQLEYSVHIAPIPGTDGVDLRNRLRAELNPFGEPADPAYKLEVKLSKSDILKGIQRTGDATWQEIRITASWRLIDSANNRAVLSGSDTVSESFTFVQNLVAADSAASTAMQSAIRILSGKISTRVKVFAMKDGSGS
ncbi:MAG: LPS assembly lipoprotein LptE [Alphaproteobacteria bacterium]|nr:LPS assembly lipoprotein LptE [Alphaproteobacteria bacterium]